MEDVGAAAELLTRAVRDGEADVDAAAHVVGACAAADGAPLGEVMDVVERAFDGEPAHHVVRAASLAWADHALGRLHAAGCEDPLTSLSTVPHLHSRLVDVYRAAAVEGRRPNGHVLVVVELAAARSASSLGRSVEVLEVGQVLRTVFPGEETVAQVAADRCVVLTTRERADATTVRLVGVLLGRTPIGRGGVTTRGAVGEVDDPSRTGSDGTSGQESTSSPTAAHDGPPARLWVEELPASSDDLPWLLQALGR